MESTKPKFEYEVNVSGLSPLPVIIVAAGNATRMNGLDKQFLCLADKPVLARTVSAFQKCPLVSKIIIVTKGDSVFAVQQLCDKYHFDKVTDIVEGGLDRHESVLCGMARLGNDDERVLVHDGARPFVKQGMIEECVEALNDFDGCVCALKVNDTVKSADSDGNVERTIDRTGLYLAQTPQGVRVQEYLAASNEFKNETFTDDVSLLEAAGKRVKIVSGNRNNIKITTREDISLALMIAQEEDLCE